MKTSVCEETGLILNEGGEPFAQMGVMIPGFCPRGNSDCQALAQIITAWDDDQGKRAFHCCGHNDGSNRDHHGDVFRVCYKNEQVDEMTDYDHRDIVDSVSFLTSALSADFNMRVNRGLTIDPSPEGDNSFPTQEEPAE